VAAAPTAATGDGAFTRAVADAYARLFDTTLDAGVTADGLIGRLRR
jgi:hypothetical protein